MVSSRDEETLDHQLSCSESKFFVHPRTLPLESAARHQSENVPSNHDAASHSIVNTRIACGIVVNLKISK